MGGIIIKKLGNKIMLFVCVFFIVLTGVYATSTSVSGADKCTITPLIQTLPFVAKEVAANGKTAVFLGTNGIIKTMDLKTYKISFNSRTINKYYNLKSIIYDGKNFVAIQNKNYIGTSQDGKKWSYKKINVSLNNIYYMENSYVGIGDNCIYQSNNLNSFMEIYKYPKFKKFYKIIKSGKTYYAFSSDSRNKDTYSIWTSNNLKSLRKIKDYFGAVPQNLIQFHNKQFISVVNTKDKTKSLSIITNGIVKDYALDNSLHGKQNTTFISGLLSVISSNNTLYGLTQEGRFVSINDDLSYDLLLSNNQAKNYVGTINSSYGTLVVIDNCVFRINMSLKSLENILYLGDNNLGLTNINYNGKEFIAYNNSSFFQNQFEYYLSNDAVNWRYINLPLKNVSCFTIGNACSLFAFSNKSQLVMLKDNKCTNIDINFPKSFGDKKLVQISDIEYTNNKFNVLVSYGNGLAVFESSDGVKWLLKADITKIKYTAGYKLYICRNTTILYSNDGYDAYTMTNTNASIQAFKKCTFISKRPNMQSQYTPNLIGIGEYNGKLTCAFSVPRNQYIVFYQSSDGENWLDIGAINIYNTEITNVPRLSPLNALFNNNKVFLTGLSNYIYEIDNLKTIKYINTPIYSQSINQSFGVNGIAKNSNTILFPTSKGIIELKDNSVSSSVYNPNTDIENNLYGPYDISINENTGETIITDKKTLSTINMKNSNFDIINYAYGKLYIYDYSTNTIEYIENSTLKNIDTNDILYNILNPYILFDNKIYYMNKGNLNSISLNNAYKNIEVNGLLGNDHDESSLDGRIMPIYLDSNRIIYWLDNYVYVKKDSKIKRLFKKQGSFADYTDGFDKNNIPVNKGSYYYMGKINTFIDGSKIYFITEDGLYYYDVKNDICQKAISDKISSYYIKMDGDKNFNITDMYDNLVFDTHRSGYILSSEPKQFIYMTEKGDIKKTDLNSCHTETLIPYSKIPESLKERCDNIAIVFSYNDLVFIQLTVEEEQQLYGSELYTYNKKTGNMDYQVLCPGIKYQ